MIASVAAIFVIVILVISVFVIAGLATVFVVVLPSSFVITVAAVAVLSIIAAISAVSRTVASGLGHRSNGQNEGRENCRRQNCAVEVTHRVFSVDCSAGWLGLCCCVVFRTYLDRRGFELFVTQKGSDWTRFPSLQAISGFLGSRTANEKTPKTQAVLGVCGLARGPWTTWWI